MKYSFRVFIVPQKDSLGWIEIEVRKYSKDGYNGLILNPLCSFKWSIETEGETPLGIFSFRAEMEHKFHDRFECGVKIVRRIMKLDNRGPEAVISNLSKIAIEAVYDPRASQFIPLQDVKGPEYQDYIDDYRMLGNDNCIFGAMAKSEEDARFAIVAKAAKRRSYKEWLTKFIEADMPVKVNEFASYPDTVPAIERLKEVTNGSQG